MSNHLQDIYDIGQQMCEALKAGDLDRFYTLVHQRGLLLNHLTETAEAAELAPEWDRLATALAEQHQILDAALVEQERRMNEELGALHRFQGARSSYGQTVPGSGILHRNLRG